VSVDSLSIEERRAGSALSFVVSEVVDIVGTFRSQYTEDGSGVPPHVTLFYPFFAPSEITPEILGRVERVTSAVRPFDFAVTGLAAFSQAVIYLTPEPATPFLELIARLWNEFTEITPYWAEYDEVVPHITIADLALAEGADLRAEVEAMITPRLPIRCTASEVRLLQRLRPAPAPWDVRASFPLGDRA